jgi:plastocyanin
MHRSRLAPLASIVAVVAMVVSACASPAAAPSESEPSPSPSEQAATASPSASEDAPESAEPSEEATAEEVRVRLESSQFDPSELTIPAGTTVLFLNADSYAHTVTEGTGGQAVEDPIVDRELAENRTVRVTFDEAGTYEITCELHPSMQLTVTVEG